MSDWLPHNFGELISLLGTLSIWFAAIAIREETKERKISNFQTLIGNHREIWSSYIENYEKLSRVLDRSANLTERPVNILEETFVNTVILHASSSFYARRGKLLPKVEGEIPDIAQFFSLPIPNAVWQKTKPLQNHDFVAFIDSILK